MKPEMQNIKMKKQEQQVTLDGKEIINQPNLGHFHYSAIKVLKEFYWDFSPTGLSLVELRQKLRTEMSKNTVATAVSDLYQEHMIMLIAKDVGPTKRRKYYKMTEKGALFFEQINKR